MALLSNLRTKLLGLGVIGGIATVASVGAASSSSPENLPALSSKSASGTQKNWDISIPGHGRQRWLDVNSNKDDGTWGIKVNSIVGSSISIPGFTPKTNRDALNANSEDIENIKKACEGVRREVEANNNENAKEKNAHMCTTGVA